MNNFRIGQRVVCILEEDNGWYDMDTGLECDGPVKGEILTVDGFDKNYYLIFNEYNFVDGYNPNCFRPLELDYEFAEEIIKQVTPKEELV